MKIFFEGLQIFILVEFFFEEVLNGLDIMIRHFLDIFYAGAVFEREVIEHRVEPLWLVFHFFYQRVIGRHNFLVKKTFEPLKFNVDSILLQREFAVVSAQGVARLGVPAVNGADGSQGSDFGD